LLRILATSVATTLETEKKNRYGAVLYLQILLPLGDLVTANFAEFLFYEVG
jgi:hypothetical protein